MTLACYYIASQGHVWRFKDFRIKEFRLNFPSKEWYFAGMKKKQTSIQRGFWVGPGTTGIITLAKVQRNPHADSKNEMLALIRELAYIMSSAPVRGCPRRAAEGHSEHESNLVPGTVRCKERILCANRLFKVVLLFSHRRACITSLLRFLKL